MTRARRRGLGAALALPLCLALASPAPARPAGGERAALDDFDLGRRAGDQLRLPARLREVSDLSLAPGGRLFAVADERAELFAVDAARGTIAGTVTLGTPAVRGDFEGLAAVDGVFYLITSQGMMYEAPDLRRVATLPFRRYDTGVGAACEIEGLGYEPADRILLIACKHPYDRALLDKVTLFRWSLERRALASPARLSVPLAAVLRGTDARAFSPSAVAREPRTGHYVLVAGPQQLLAEITPAGVVLPTRALSRRAHRQPEGLAFLGDSVMLISDEGGAGHATLTRYRRAR